MKEVGITKYIQLYNAGKRSEIYIYSNNTNAYLKDTFFIMDENGNKLAEFTQRFASDQFIKYYRTYKKASVTATSNAEMGEYMYKNFTADELREKYEPSQFDVTTYKDGVKNYSISKIYNYDKNGEVATTKANLNHVNYYRHPTSVKSKIYYPYCYKYYDEEEKPYDRVDYTLGNTDGSQNYSIKNYRYTSSVETRVGVQATGTAASDTGSTNRANSIDLYFNKTSNFMEIEANLKDSSTSSYGTDKITKTGETSKRIQVSLNTLDSETKTLLEQKVTVNANVNGTEVTETDYTLGDAISTYLSDYIQFSKKTDGTIDTTDIKVSNGTTYTVPKKIYARANFPSTYTEVAGHDFLNVELVPVAAGEDSFKYVGIYDSTTGSDGETTYSDAFDECVANETPMTESSYVPSFATLYADNITSVAAGTYTDKKENPFPAASAE